MTDKHTTEHSKTASLGIYWPMCDVYIAHTTIYPEVSISLTEMPFLILQVNFHTSNDFCDWRLVTRWTKQAFSCSKFLSPGGQLWANTAFEGSQFYSIGVPKFYSWVNVISVYVHNDLG